MCSKADLSNARAKLNWADAQINILDREIGSFIDREPYRFREKPKPHFQREPNEAQRKLFEAGRFFEVVLTEEVPTPIKAGIGMVVQAQRDSLDYLAYALAVKNGAVEPNDVYFVIADSDACFSDKGAQRKLRRLSEDDRLTIEALKPYKGGNNLLSSLRWLNNKSKHRDLIAIATMPDVMHLGHSRYRRLLILPPGNTLCPNEQLICIEANAEAQLHLSATIAFREIGHAQGQPVIETLREFSRLANSIIDLFS